MGQEGKKDKKKKKKTGKNVGLDNTNFATQGESCRASFLFFSLYINIKQEPIAEAICTFP